VPEILHGADKQIPRPDADRARQSAACPKVHQDTCAQTGQRIERGKDHREHQAAPQTDGIGLPVCATEIGVHGRFLAKVLGNADPGDGFLDVAVDVGEGAAGLLAGAARDRRNNSAEAMIIGAMIIKTRVSRHSVSARISVRTSSTMIWPIRSVTSTIIWANSCVSEVIRLTILPAANSS